MRERAEIVGLEGEIDGVVGAREQLTLVGNGLEAGARSEFEVERQIFVLVAHRQHVVLPLVLGALSKLDLLLADLHFGIASSGHHLDLQILMLHVLETHDRHRRVVFWLHLELLLTHLLGAGHATVLGASRETSLHSITEAALFVVFLGPANECDGDLGVWGHHSVLGFGGENALSHLFACLGWRDEVLGGLRVVFV